MTKAEQRFHELTNVSGAEALARVQDFARHDVVVACEYFVEDEATFEPVVLAHHHRAIVDAVRYAWEHGQHAVCLAPWGAGKTALLEAIAAFVLGSDVRIRGKIASA